MKSFNYTITDELGIHARPAGMLCKLAKSLGGTVTFEKGGKTADASRVIALMGMGIKQGDCIKVTVEGGDEENAVMQLETFLKENL